MPRSLWDEGMRRYGFHGLSYEYIIAQVGATALGRAIVAHLGNGVSITRRSHRGKEVHREHARDIRGRRACAGETAGR